MHTLIRLCTIAFLLAFGSLSVSAQSGPKRPAFSVIAFYTAKNDQAHISFVHEANRWFAAMGAAHGFRYDSTADWNKLNAGFLTSYQVVIFLDTRPDEPAQRMAFETYMKQGGGWLGFHFAAFALTPSTYPQNWDWYHQHFLGSGSYASNTWRPTSAVLRVEAPAHPVVKGLSGTFTSAPNEWYRWSNDLRQNPDITILLAIDSTSFPLGTGPKPHEIWHSGYYPVAWTNRNYRMIYLNMGHNDIDYTQKPSRELSSSFGNPSQDRLILNSLLWLGRSKRKP
ncbi:ThuA domain-containing protein [Fibrella sp. USSR17]